MSAYQDMPRGSSGIAGGNSIIDFRSDTVTLPGRAMRKAMADAEVGDDVYGDDPTVNALEEHTAELLGKEAGLFVSSGTQSNLIALLTHCGRGDEYIGGNIYHISLDEAAGAAVLGGISPLHLPTTERGGLTASQVKAAIKPDDVHYARTRLVCLENTVNGVVQDQSEIEAIAETARENGLITHLDGARLMNAAIASGILAKNLVAKIDTVSLCLSKGLGAPVGSVLCGPADFIHRARYNRKMLGGGMRQAGILAAAGRYALDHQVDRLAKDHARAHRLADVLANMDKIEVDQAMLGTNMVFFRTHDGDHQRLQQYLQSQGVVIGAQHPDIRIVVHLDIDDRAIDRLIEGVANFVKQADQG